MDHLGVRACVCLSRFVGWRCSRGDADLFLSTGTPRQQREGFTSMTDYETCMLRSNSPGQPDRVVRIFVASDLHPAIYGIIDTRRLGTAQVDVVLPAEIMSPAVARRAG